jgi:hypothetical protein
MFMYLGQLDSNYIIFWNAEIFRKHLIFDNKKILKERKEKNLMEYLGIYPFVKMESSN